MNCKEEIKINEIIDIDTIKFKISKPTNCGFCGNGIDPKVISYSLIDDSYHAELYVFMECPVCNEIFICVYPFSEDDLTFDSIQTHGYSKILGEGLLNEKFSEEINDISPKFVTIYNEAYRAEQMGLKNIIGAVYRKAFEFLVKDFAIYLNPNDKDSIITKNLCEVIKTAFPTDLLELFTKTSWIGNDSIHYENKHDEFNTKVFKSLIKICISDIEKEIRKKQYLERIQKK